MLNENMQPLNSRSSQCLKDQIHSFEQSSPSGRKRVQVQYQYFGFGCIETSLEYFCQTPINSEQQSQTHGAC
jgi:hypothetical protein